MRFAFNINCIVIGLILFTNPSRAQQAKILAEPIDIQHSIEAIMTDYTSDITSENQVSKALQKTEIEKTLNLIKTKYIPNAKKQNKNTASLENYLTFLENEFRTQKKLNKIISECSNLGVSQQNFEMLKYGVQKQTYDVPCVSNENSAANLLSKQSQVNNWETIISKNINPYPELKSKTALFQNETDLSKKYFFSNETKKFELLKTAELTGLVYLNSISDAVLSNLVYEYNLNIPKDRSDAAILNTTNQLIKKYCHYCDSKLNKELSDKVLKNYASIKNNTISDLSSISEYLCQSLTELGYPFEAINSPPQFTTGLSTSVAPVDFNAQVGNFAKDRLYKVALGSAVGSLLLTESLSGVNQCGNGCIKTRLDCSNAKSAKNIEKIQNALKDAKQSIDNYMTTMNESIHPNDYSEKTKNDDLLKIYELNPILVGSTVADYPALSAVACNVSRASQNKEHREKMKQHLISIGYSVAGTALTFVPGTTPVGSAILLCSKVGLLALTSYDIGTNMVQAKQQSRLSHSQKDAFFSSREKDILELGANLHDSVARENWDYITKNIENQVLFSIFLRSPPLTMADMNALLKLMKISDLKLLSTMSPIARSTWLTTQISNFKNMRIANLKNLFK